MGQLRGLEDVTVRKMFGGAGLYKDGVIFGLVAEATMYLKVDEENRGYFEEMGMNAFQPFADRPMKMPYYEVPPEVLEDPDELAIWSMRSVEVSLKKK